MKVYDAVFDGKKGSGVYALSCVEDPAMEDVWITLKKQPIDIQFAAVDQEKRLLLGAALIPNKKIYRKYEDEEFFVKFSEDTIEQVAHAFQKNSNQNNSTRNHETPLEGVSVVETWIVKDSERDKSAVYGKKYEKGTWAAMMHVSEDAQQTWEDAKNGKLKGFSIDALLGLREIEFKQQIMSDKKSIKDQILEAFKELKFGQKEVKMGQLKLKDAKTVIEFEGEKPEVGMPVFALSEDQRIPLPEGSHELEGGEVLHVDKNGLVAAAPVEEPEIKEVVTEMTKAFQVELSKVREDFKVELQKTIGDLKAAHKVELDAEKKKVDELEVKLAAEPAAQKIVKVDLIKEPKTREERLRNVAYAALNQN